MSAKVVQLRQDYVNGSVEELREAGVIIMAANMAPHINESREITKFVKLFKESLEEFSLVSRRHFKESIS